MKTIIIFRIVGCLLLFLTTKNNSFTQVTTNSEPLKKVYTVSGNQKDKYTNSEYAPANASLAVNNKVQKSFDQYFAGVTGQYWSEVGAGFHNSFYLNGVHNCALFSKNGRLIYSISYGSEKDLPADLRKIIKREYYDYDITMVIEVKEQDRNIWVVNMEDDTTYLTIRVEDDEMEQVQEFERPK